MLSEERRELILREVRDAGFVHATELASRLDVSRATVWRDIDRLARTGAIAKVYGGAAAPQGRQSGVPTRESVAGLTVGMQVPTNTYYYRAVIEGARQACEAVGARLVIGVSGYTSLEADLESIRGLVGVGVAGLLLTPAHVDPSTTKGGLMQVMGEFEIPAVLVERDIAGVVSDDLASVTTAREAGVFAAVDHLAGLGHTRIGFVSIRQRSRSQLRICRGYREAIAELPVEEPAETGQWEWRSDLSNAEILARIRQAGVTGVVVFGDTLATALSHDAQRLGWAIPTDLSIISYDNEIARDALPPLTAISPERHTVGRTAARYLLEHLAGTEPLAGRRLQIQPSLVVRESTVPPRTN